MSRAPRASVVLASVLLLAACASSPKPAPLASTPSTPPAPPTSRSEAAPPVGPVQGQVLPGTAKDFVIKVGDRVYFDYDKSDIRSDAAGVLALQAAWLVRYRDVMVRIEDNCDERGTREYNFALGASRAAAVRDFLLAHGVNGGRITTVSYGKEQPIDPGEGEEHWAHDRNAHTAILSGAAPG